MILRELKINIKSLLLWSISFAILIYFGMTKFEVMTGANSSSINQLVQGMPQMMRALYGIDGIDLATIEGYFGIVLLYVVVMVAVHGSFLGCRLLHREMKERTAESLFVKPKSRSYFLTQKLIGGFVVIALLDGIILCLCALTLGAYWTVDLSIKTAVALIVTHLAFYGLGFFLTLVLTQTKRAQSIALFLILAGYFSMVVASLIDNSALRMVSPIGCYGTHYLTEPLSNTLPYGIGALVIVALLIVIGFKRFQTKDL